MKIYAAHLGPAAAPVLLREGFAWGGLLCGPLWLAAHRAFVPACLLLLAWAVALALTPAPLHGPLALLLALFAGTCGQDMRGWDLERRGRHLVRVIAAPDADAALARLLAARPDLIPLTARL